jgi:hypothetical protein
MFLIDYPYISEFLKETISANNYPVIQTKHATELLKGITINWISTKDAIAKLKKEPNYNLYTNSENAIDWVLKNIPTSDKANWIKVFKDKFLFRELISDIYPNFFYKKIALTDIQTLDVDKLNFPFVIKPNIGFFSLGVHVVYNKNDWNQIKQQLQPENLKHQFPDSVINTTNFIIEKYASGKEYAIDCYFDENGNPIIQNILLHKFASDTDVSDRVYYTSKEIILKYHKKLSEFLSKIGSKMNLKNFPIHIEVKIDNNGTIIPIEVNPMRFGGWCTTADLTWFSYGFNPYINYTENKKPNWNSILINKENYKYAMLILNPLKPSIKNIQPTFDYQKLHKKFEKVLHVRKIDYQKFLFFGFAFISTKNEQELDSFLKSDLNGYLLANQPLK